MSKLEKIKNDPQCILRKILSKGNFKWMPDTPYLKLMYYAHFGEKLNLKNPETFNEKLQWLKLYAHRPEYTAMVDKHEVKKIVAEQIGEEYVIPTYGVWERVDDIDFAILPNQFVLKCTHDCGSVLICKDKGSFDIDKAKKKLNNGLSNAYFYWGREWPYKNVKPRIIAEAYMEDTETKELRDYKFFCFHGEPKALFVATDRQTPGEEVKFDFFDMEYNHIDVKNGHPNAEIHPVKPKQFELMRELAQKLSRDIPHVRVDFYEIDGRVYFGELTFFHFSGMVPFEPEEWDRKLGDWIKLPIEK